MHEMRDSVQSQLETAKRKEEPYFLGEYFSGTLDIVIRRPHHGK